MAYSLDFRKKVIIYCERSRNISEAANIFQISRNTIYKWLRLQKKTGNLANQVNRREKYPVEDIKGYH